MSRRPWVADFEVSQPLLEVFQDSLFDGPIQGILLAHEMQEKGDWRPVEELAYELACRLDKTTGEEIER